MTPRLCLPTSEGGLEEYDAGRREPVPVPVLPVAPPRSRVAFAAAHVVADPLADIDPTAETRLDWDATLGFRRHLWSLGLGVAEAMDTAQRGMGLDWPATRELIRRSSEEARSVGGRIACGAGTDQLPSTSVPDLDAVTRAYEEQIEVVEQAGAQVVLLASRALAAAAHGPDGYAKVYGRLLDQVRSPVIVHWLGEVFDPQLAGYWGTTDVHQAAEVVLAIVHDHRDRVDGIKVSLLDERFEVELRRRLPGGVRLYTGDDFSYPDLILGDEHGHSDAVLGVFDAIAPAAAVALRALDDGDADGYRRVLDPTVTLARHLFGAPAYHYKTGVVFLAFLNGHQRHFRMVGGYEGARSLVHLARLFVLADRAGLLADPALAAARMRHVLALGGVDA
ncbi:MAG: DUF993 family protein [Acidimicrobiales bacterium]